MASIMTLMRQWLTCKVVNNGFDRRLKIFPLRRAKRKRRHENLLYVVLATLRDHKDHPPQSILHKPRLLLLFGCALSTPPIVVLGERDGESLHAVPSLLFSSYERKEAVSGIARQLRK